MPALTALLLSLISKPALAHGAASGTADSHLLIATLILIAAWLYARGIRRLWQVAGAGRGVSRYGAAAFAAGLFALAFALLSPLDDYSGHLFSAHMLQHEVLMLVAAPLLVLGRPLATWTWGLEPAPRACVSALEHIRLVSRAWKCLTDPVMAWSIHGAAIWIWHTPALFAAAQSSEFVHALQHSSFLFSALLFWWALLKTRSVSSAYGAAVLYLFTTMIHTGALGALLVFSEEVWYPFNSAGATGWGLTALEDQQLGGLTMWIPGGLVYCAAAMAMLYRWLASASATVRELR